MLNRGTPDQISKTYILSYFHYVEFLLRSNRKMEEKKTGKIEICLRRLL